MPGQLPPLAASLAPRAVAVPVAPVVWLAGSLAPVVQASALVVAGSGR
ncbi:MAG TPA: hypothetical protein VN614_10430 [Rhodanobacter sp.]|nr:hypothetical protein [Rhodanobacter sp.]